MHGAPKRVLPLLLFASLFAMIALFTQLYVTSNPANRFALTQAIVKHRTLSIDETLFQLIPQEQEVDRAEFQGRAYSGKPPFGSFVGVLIYAPIEPLALATEWEVYLTSLAISGLPGALVGLLVFLYARSKSDDLFLAVLFGLATVASSNLIYWSLTMFSHALTAFLIAATFFLVTRSHSFDRRLAFTLGGTLAGCAVCNDYFVILTVPPLLMCLYFQRRVLTDTLFFVLGALPVALALMAYNWACFGSPIDLSHDHLAHPYLSARHGHGLLGLSLPDLWHLMRILFDPHIGLFVYNPFAMFCLASIVFMRNRTIEHWTVGAICGVMLLADSGLVQHETTDYGSAWGPRYLMPLVPLLGMVSLPSNPSTRFRVLAVAFALAGFALNFYIVNINLLPPPGEQLHLLFDLGPMQLRFSGGLNVYAQWRFLNQQPVGFGTSLLTTGSTLAAILGVWLAFWWRNDRTFASDGDES